MKNFAILSFPVVILLAGFTACIRQPADAPRPGSEDEGASIRLHFDPRDASAAEQRDWPVTFGVPFPKGLLHQTASLHLRDAEGGRFPLQSEVTARWPDGSLKWVLLDSRIPLAEGVRSYALGYNAADPVPVFTHHGKVEVEENGDTILLNTGVMKLALDRRTLRVFDAVHVRETAEDSWTGLFPEGKSGDLLLVDGEGVPYRGQWEDEPEVLIEEAGPLRATVKLEGWTRSADGQRLGRHIVRVQAFAGKRWVRVYHTFVKTADSEAVAYRTIALELPYYGDRFHFHGAGMENPHGAEGGGSLLQYRHDRFQVVTDAGTADREGRAPGVVTVSSGGTAYTVSRRFFHEMFPAGLDVGPQRLRLEFWPERGRPAEHSGDRLTERNIGQLWWVHEGDRLDFRVPEEIRSFADYRRPDAENVILNAFDANALGISRTLEYVLDFHGKAAPSPEGVAMRHPPLMTVDPEWLAASGAFGQLAPRREAYAELEDALERTLKFLPAMYERMGVFGLWNFGAYNQTYHPSLDFAMVHRHWKGFHQGGPRWPWLAYIRSGDPEIYDFAEIHARHLMDVCTAHWEDAEYNRRMEREDLWWGHNYSQVYRGGLRRYKGLVHWYGGNRMHYNAQVDYALWYWYLTGYRRAWDVAMMKGEFLLRARSRIDDPESSPGIYSRRNGTGRGAAALDLYAATGDERFLEIPRAQLRRFVTEEAREPGLGVNNIYYAPFLNRYREVLGPDPELDAFIVKAARHRMHHWRGRDTWYDLMALAYGITGDVDFLQHGLENAAELLLTRGYGSDPMLEGVLVSPYAGRPGYTAQQWGTFVAALDEHAARTGSRLALEEPQPPVSTHSFSVRTPGLTADGRTQAPPAFVFHVRREEGESVHIPFSFTVSGGDHVDLRLHRISGGTPQVIDTRRLPVEKRKVDYTFSVNAEQPAAAYRLEFSGATLEFNWPLDGDFKKMVMEMPVWMRPEGGLWFKPLSPVDGRAPSLQLSTRIRPDRTVHHFISDAAGNVFFRQTESGRENGPLDRRFALPQEASQGLWHYRATQSGLGGHGTFLSGDILPVISFSPQHFFIPEHLDGK